MDLNMWIYHWNEKGIVFNFFIICISTTTTLLQ